MSKNISDKEYKNLSIQISLNGLSFYSMDTINHLASPVSHIPFEDDATIPFDIKLNLAFKNEASFQHDYDAVTVIYDNNLFTPVPSPLFDKNNLNEYLKHSTKTLAIDEYSFDIIENHNIHNVYIPTPGIVAVCNNYFSNISYKHATSILTKSLLDLSKNSYEAQFYVHVQEKHFEIIVINRGKLLLLNSYEYTTKEDFLYYILFVAEQLKLNPEAFQLFFLGIIKPHDELHEITYKYVRHIYLIDQNSCNPKELNLDYTSCFKNFILVNS